MTWETLFFSLDKKTIQSLKVRANSCQPGYAACNACPSEAETIAHKDRDGFHWHKHALFSTKPADVWERDQAAFRDYWRPQIPQI